MKQQTLFDLNIAKVKTKILKTEVVENNDYKLQKVVYKPSKLDSDKISGFDCSLTDWIYPTNYPVRDYQLQIVQQCLYKNTLVCLPTGLGKTFIATVTMFNFYRWYPLKKIVFVAPTRPLVRQQMLSATECVPIDTNNIVEMTGSISQSTRITLWKDKRVFFLTAQVFVNDLTNGLCPVDDVVMIVLDEAHKATGNHSYCQIIRLLSSGSRLFRVLGLSATPGNDIASIQCVIQNLLISHIELRTDECKDIQIYSHERKIDEIIVPLGVDVTAYRDRLYKISEPLLERLKNSGAIKPYMTVQSASKFGLLTQKNEYKNAVKNASYYILSDFSAAICLYHAIELVQQHGLRPLFQFLSNTMVTNNSMPHIIDLMKNNDFMDIIKDLEEKFKSDFFVGGHPKLEKLKEIVKEHFEKNKTPECQTRVMVFSQFRDSVNEILRLLEQLKPLVRPMGFVGRAHNGSQKEQLEAMRLFINGDINVLVSTCIGEEGLDVGEIDLIVCFDAQGSPIRLVQRLGRTGRKRVGRIVMLLSEGKEVSSYRSSLRKKSRIHSAIFEGYKHLLFYPDNPRLVPIGLEPSLVFQKYILKRKILPVKHNTLTLQKAVNISEIPKINFEIERVGHMVLMGEQQYNIPTFTQKYHSDIHKKCLYQSQKTFHIGHSSLCINVISILKLKELHCRGETNMLYHLNNSRTLDIEEPITQNEYLCPSVHSLNSFSFSLSETSNDDDENVKTNSSEVLIKKCLRKEIFYDILDELDFRDIDDEESMSHISISSVSSTQLVSVDEHVISIQSPINESKKITLLNSSKVINDKSPILITTEDDFISLDLEFKSNIIDSIKDIQKSTLNTDQHIEGISTLPSIEIKDQHSFKRDKDTGTGLKTFIDVMESKVIECNENKLTMINDTKLFPFISNSISFESSILKDIHDPIGFSTPKKLSTLKCYNTESNKINFFHKDNFSNSLETSTSINKENKIHMFNNIEANILKNDVSPITSHIISNNNYRNKKITLLKCFSVSKDKSSNILSLEDKRKSLLNSFHHVETNGVLMGFESALNIIGASDIELSTDLFDDDFIFERSIEKKNIKLSILNSFNINTSDKFDIDAKSKVNVKENILHSDEDLFPDDELFLDDSIDFSPSTSHNVNNAPVTLQIDEDDDLWNNSNNSENFLQTKSLLISSNIKSNVVSLIINTSLTDNEKCISDEKIDSCESPSFDSSFNDSHNDVIEDIDLRGLNLSNQYEFKCNSNKMKRKFEINDYFLSQADLSGSEEDENEEYNESNLDIMEDSFIDDTHTNNLNDTQMQQIYARSLQVLSFKEYRRPFIDNHKDIVDTQYPIEEDYMYDSFVVPDNYKSPKNKIKKSKLDSYVQPKKFKRLKIDEKFIE